MKRAYSQRKEARGRGPDDHEPVAATRQRRSKRTRAAKQASGPSS